MRFTLRGFLSNAFVLIGISVFFAGLIVAQPPKVAVDVATAATEAAKEDQPILPDDFGAKIGATWESPQIEPGVTLFTTDGSFRCLPCEKQEKILIDAGGMTTDGVPIWPFKIEKVGNRTVPQWVTSTGEVMIGAREPVSLKKWIESHAVRPEQKNPVRAVVSVDGSDSRAVLLALAEAIRRESETQPAVTGFLPAIPIDLDDDLLKVLDGLLSSDGYNGNGLKLIWPAGDRKMTFEPGLSASFRRIVEVDAVVNAISIKGRDVTLSLSGTIVKELTVRLK